MNNNNKRVGIIAFESEGIYAVGAQVEPDPAARVDIAVAENSLLVEADANTARQAGVTEADQVIAVTQTLANISGELAETTRSGGVSAGVAGALNAAVEHLCRQAKLPQGNAFCLENFGGRMANQQATKLAMESISTHLKSAMLTLVKWFKAAFDYFKDGFIELTQGADNLADRARDVQVKANSIAHKTIKENKTIIKNTSFTSFMVTEEGAAKADEVAERYTKYTELMGTGFSAFLKQMVLQVNEAVTEAKQGDTKEETAAKVDTVLNALKQRAFSQFSEVSSTDTGLVLDYVLPYGEKTLVASLAKDDGRLSGLHVVIEKSKSKSSAGLTEERLSTLTHEQIVKISKAVEKEMLFGLFKDYLTTKSDLSKIEKLVDEACQKITDAQQAPEGGNDTAVMYSVHFLKELVSSTINMTAAVHRYDILLAKHLLDYCMYSVKMHG
jgi:hypothetical protein